MSFERTKLSPLRATDGILYLLSSFSPLIFFFIKYLITLKIHSNYVIKGSAFIGITHDPTQFHLLSFVRFNSH